MQRPSRCGNSFPRLAISEGRYLVPGRKGMTHVGSCPISTDIVNQAVESYNHAKTDDNSKLSPHKSGSRPEARGVHSRTTAIAMTDGQFVQPSLLTRLHRHLRWGDYLVAGLFGVLATAPFWLFPRQQANGAPCTAQILINNVLQREIFLQQAQGFTVQGRLGEVLVEVNRFGVCIRASACPNQFCVRQGYVSRPGQMLVCVPNHLVILLVGSRQNHFDAVTY